MQVSVETLEGLGRKLLISVPSDKIEEKVNSRLKELAGKAKMDGFRPGHAPLKLVRSRYAKQIREEVAKDMVQPSLYEALTKHELVPASQPEVEIVDLDTDKDFTYSVEFEVFPTISIEELQQDEVQQVHAEVTESDIDAMLDKLREENKQWDTVHRAVEEGDKIIFDFSGICDGEPIEGGAAENHELVIGSGSMIPGFEDGLVGAEIDKPIEFDVTFPEEYHSDELAGKKATFTCIVKSIQAGALPELDDEFAKKLGVKSGDIDGLKADLKLHMERELQKRVSTMNREALFNALSSRNTFEVPKALIDQEIEKLKHEMFHQLFGPEHKPNEKIPDFPRELFLERATKQVELGLLLSEYISKHKIAADKERVTAMLDTLAGAYENPQELRDWYEADKKRMAEIEALVTEEMVSEKIAESAKLIKKNMSYNDVVNPKQQKQDTGA